MAAIYPTGTCFDDALDYLVCRVLEDPRLIKGRRLLLVHGIGLIPADAAYRATPNAPFAHAWVEEADVCWTTGLLNGERVLVRHDRGDFYRRLRIQSTTVYTPRQAHRENVRTNSFGPWRAEYLALCRNAPPIHAPSTAAD
jgi:hypothetical protein